MRIWVAGGDVAAEALDAVVGGVIDQMNHPTVVVAPLDGAVVAGGQLPVSGAAALWGLAVDETTSMRWRTEGPATLASVVSEADLGLPEALGPEQFDLEPESGPILRLWHRYVAGSPLAEGVREIRYVDDSHTVRFIRYAPGDSS